MRRFLAVLFLLSCHGKLLTVRVADSSVTEVPRGTPLQSLLGDLGFDDFVAMEIADRQELANQGVEPGDITEVFVESIVLEVDDPPGGDLSFLDELEFWVEAPGLPRTLVAWQDEFPEGEARVELILEGVDIVDYVLAEKMDLTTEVRGGLPDDDTRVIASYVIAVGATARGACRQAKGD